ncbi:2Fe-2S iron-sulfur cluster binding domain-containing protein [Chitinophaga sp. G-6-1-13]|uniref:2Fe-2S iron-sulfur cluster binding domain-containing protein n=1 Tax=Chitinophaga fulva TaxID=2728842 RepID=A0A848GWE4_9BACT|nr:2Fe-2S iron-sulfur cluster-binding protein [Chitinophaga fulva]NML39998.1 2Fe-2S iron-sulfur cluster binding domain-containing protein [Chitinophaga fulva]
MATVYKLTLINDKKGINETVEIEEGMFILNAAAEAEIALPFLCRTGDCSSCVCKLVSGSVRHSAQSVLSEAELKEGYTLACSAYATSDIVIETHKEKELAKYRKGI